MTEHTELPWTSKGEAVYHQTPAGCLMVTRGPEWKNEAGHQLVKANAEFIVRACNAHKDLLDACENAVKQMGDAPVQGCGEWQRGLFCGLEDMEITDRYAACRYGYDKALSKVQEWIIEEIEAAIEKTTIANSEG